MAHRSHTRFSFVLAAALFGAPGAAMAEGIEISGTASMGLVGGSDQTDPARVRLLTDLDLQMRLSRTTDSGLTFALEIDLDRLVGDRTQDRSSTIPRRR